MADIPESYVSPNLRLAFAREDYPALVITTEVRPIGDVGIHEAFRNGSEWAVVATITVPGHTPVSAWKEIPALQERRNKPSSPTPMTPETLVKYETIAIGRALKRFGYPDKAPEFKLLLLWRERNRTMARTLGDVPALSPAAEFGAQLDAHTAEAAALTTGDADDVYDGDDDDEVTDGTIEDEPGDPGPTPDREAGAVVAALATVTNIASTDDRAIVQVADDDVPSGQEILAAMRQAPPEVKSAIATLVSSTKKVVSAMAFDNDPAWAKVVYSLIVNGPPS